MKLTFNELRELVNDIEYRPSAFGVRFGCDCGCGGDSFSFDEWNEEEAKANNAILKLKDLGVIFTNED